MDSSLHVAIIVDSHFLVHNRLHFEIPARAGMSFVLPWSVRLTERTPKKTEAPPPLRCDRRLLCFLVALRVFSLLVSSSRGSVSLSPLHHDTLTTKRGAYSYSLGLHHQKKEKATQVVTISFVSRERIVLHPCIQRMSLSLSSRRCISC